MHGPWETIDTALAPRQGSWDSGGIHGPSVHREPTEHGGRYVLFYEATATRMPPLDCRHNASVPIADLSASRRIGAASAASPDGPWRRLDRPLLGPRAPPAWDATDVSNAAPLILRNGTTLLAYRAGGDGVALGGGIGIALSRTSWEGPYARVGDSVTRMLFAAEDGALYRDARGHFHMLVHRFAGGANGSTAGDAVGGHAWSVDGLSWQYDARAVAYTTSVTWGNGSAPTALYRRERPKPLLDAASGRLVALFNGAWPCHVGAMDDDSRDGHAGCWTFTLQTSVGDGAADGGAAGDGTDAADGGAAGYGTAADDGTVDGGAARGNKQAPSRTPDEMPPRLASRGPSLTYSVHVRGMRPSPVLEYPTSSAFQQVFNPTWVHAPHPGLLARVQNCSGVTPGTCTRCSGPGARASRLVFARRVSNGGGHPASGGGQRYGGTGGDALSVDGGAVSSPWESFAAVDGASVVFGPHDASDDFGTEDPRIVFDEARGVHWMYYTCYNSGHAPQPSVTLCAASTPDPTDDSNWTRYGPVGLPAGSKSGAPLLLPSTGGGAPAEHLLFWGSGVIRLSRSSNLAHWPEGRPFMCARAECSMWRRWTCARGNGRVRTRRVRAAAMDVRRPLALHAPKSGAAPSRMPSWDPPPAPPPPAHPSRAPPNLLLRLHLRPLRNSAGATPPGATPTSSLGHPHCASPRAIISSSSTLGAPPGQIHPATSRPGPSSPVLTPLASSNGRPRRFGARSDSIG